MRRKLEKIFALLLIVTMMVSPVMTYASETNSEEKSEDMQMAEDIEKDAEKTDGAEASLESILPHTSQNRDAMKTESQEAVLSEYDIKTLADNSVQNLEPGTPTYPGSGEIWYEFTPKASGMYVIEASTDKNINFYYYDHAYESYNCVSFGWEYFLSLNAGETYYIQTSDWAVDDFIWLSDTPLSIGLGQSYDASDIIEYWEWGASFYEFTPQESDYYTFACSGDNSAVRAFLPYDDYGGYVWDYYDASSWYEQNVLTIWLDAGETYYFWASYDEPCTVELTQGADMVTYFDKSANKTSAASGETVGFTETAQVVMPEISIWGSEQMEVSSREWTPDDFTLTFHDELDDGFVLDKSSINVIYYRGDGNGNYAEFDLSKENPEENELFEVVYNTDDSCSFEVTVNLSEMWWTETDESFNDYYLLDPWYELPYSYFELTYDAALSENIGPGAYYNTAYATAFMTDYSFGGGGDVDITSIKPYAEEYGYSDTSAPVTVEVDTYGVTIYKLDGYMVNIMEAANDDARTLKNATGGLSGAKFTLSTADGSISETLVTDGSGYAYSTNTFADGTELVLTETEAPDGYRLLDEPIEFTLYGDWTDDYWYLEEVENDAIGADIWLYKIIDNTDEEFYISGLDPYEEYDFTIVFTDQDSGKEYEYQVSNQDGWYIEELPYGTYIVTEKEDDVFNLVQMEANGSFVHDAVNIKPYDTEGTLVNGTSNVYFDVYETDENGNPVSYILTITDDDNGYNPYFEIEVINEISNVGYNLDINKTDTGGNPIEGAEFVLGCFGENVRSQYGTTETYASTPDGEYWYYYLKLDYDESSGAYTWNPDYAFDLKDEATVMTTDANGNIELDGLWPSNMLGGDYFLIETKAPDGYELIEDPIVFTVSDDGSIEIVVDNESASMNSSGDTMTVVDEKAGFNIRLYKYDKNRYTEAAVSLQNDSNIDAYAVTNYSLYGAEFILSRTGNSGNTEYTVADMNQPNDYDNYNYTITGWTENENEATVFISNGNGYIEFSNLPAGKYTVTETNAPYGYILLSEPVVFTVSDTGGVSIDSGPAVWDDYYGIAIGNENASETVVKTDEDGNRLSGAEFILGVYYHPYAEDSLFDSSAESNVETYGETSDGKYQYEYVTAWYDSETGIYWWDYTVGDREDATRLVTDEEGKINLDGLYPTSNRGDGGYFLIETKAPDGYDMLQDPIVFTIDDYGKIEISTDTAQVGVSDDGTTLTVVDYTSGRMPDAGADGILWYLIFGFGTVGIVSCMAVVRRRIHV